MISVVVPALNEQENIAELYRRVTEAAKGWGSDHELLIVDDGSTDNTVAILEQLASTDPRLKVVSLTRNFGHQAAVTAGLHHARGSIICVLDADLQDDPSLIPIFLERIEAGADVVSGWKQKRHDPLEKTLPSRLFNAVVRKLTGVELRDFNSGFKAYRSECIRELRRDRRCILQRCQQHAVAIDAHSCRRSSSRYCTASAR